MSRLHGRLTALAVKHAVLRGIYGDGNGLCLQVARGGSRSWILRYRLGGRRRHLGLGGFPSVSLAEAREFAAAARALLREGKDPVEARRGQRIAAVLSAAKTVTFAEAAERFIEAHAAGRTPKSTAQWRVSLATYAYPVIGALPVQEIDVGLVMKVIGPLWATKVETASRVRARIEMILDWAKVNNHRTGENPARWSGNIQQLLPPPTKVSAVVPHVAMAYAHLPAFMMELHQRSGTDARALEFLILTAARAGEVRLADWSEVDLQARVWTLPGSRMKAGRGHRVALSTAAIVLLEALPGPRTGLVFQGTKPGRPLGHTQMARTLERMDRGDVTVHGMRSAFSTWAAECTAFPSELIEVALAHVVGSAVARAYQRGDMLERRVSLMEAWASFCCRGKVPVSADVIDLDEQRRA